MTKSEAEIRTPGKIADVVLTTADGEETLTRGGRNVDETVSDGCGWDGTQSDDFHVRASKLRFDESRHGERADTSQLSFGVATIYR